MIYGKMVTVGQYLIVADTNINGHPVPPEFVNCPWKLSMFYLNENAL
jgi:cephalosporin hydroxylase